MGTVTLIDFNGKMKPLGRWNNILGLAWSKDGNEIFVTAADKANNDALYGLNPETLDRRARVDTL